MAAESKIQSKIVKYLKTGNYENNKTIKMSKSGWPDLLAVKSGIVYLFEVKPPEENLEPLQRATIDKLNKDKEIAFVVRSLEQFIEIWESL